MTSNLINPNFNFFDFKVQTNFLICKTIRTDVNQPHIFFGAETFIEKSDAYEWQANLIQKKMRQNENVHHYNAFLRFATSPKTIHRSAARSVIHLRA